MAKRKPKLKIMVVNDTRNQQSKARPSTLTIGDIKLLPLEPISLPDLSTPPEEKSTKNPPSSAEKESDSDLELPAAKNISFMKKVIAFKPKQVKDKVTPFDPKVDQQNEDLPSIRKAKPTLRKISIMSQLTERAKTAPSRLDIRSIKSIIEELDAFVPFGSEEEKERNSPVPPEDDLPEDDDTSVSPSLIEDRKLPKPILEDLPTFELFHGDSKDDTEVIEDDQPEDARPADEPFRPIAIFDSELQDKYKGKTVYSEQIIRAERQRRLEMQKPETEEEIVQKMLANLALLPKCVQKAIQTCTGPSPKLTSAFLRQTKINPENCGPDASVINGDCYKKCPEHFEDNELFCRKPQAKVYSTKYIHALLLLADERQVKSICPGELNELGICRWNCPDGWRDHGVRCQKPKTKINGAFSSTAEATTY